jgi:hypothetical protein
MKNNLANLVEIASFKALQLALQELKDDIEKQIARLEVVYHRPWRLPHQMRSVSP